MESNEQNKLSNNIETDSDSESRMTMLDGRGVAALGENGEGAEKKRKKS